jgi:hypothetical protein
MSNQIIWIDLIQEKHNEELKSKFSDKCSDQGLIDNMFDGITNTCYLNSKVDDNEEDVLNNIVNDVISNYYQEKEKVFDRLRDKWR